LSKNKHKGQNDNEIKSTTTSASSCQIQCCNTNTTGPVTDYLHSNSTFKCGAVVVNETKDSVTVVYAATVSDFSLAGEDYWRPLLQQARDAVGWHLVSNSTDGAVDWETWKPNK
jgi:hypothetical protein